MTLFLAYFELVHNAVPPSFPPRLPGPQRVLITQRTITSTSLKTAAGQGPPAVFRFRVFAARSLLIVKYGLKTASGE